jgi:hypothetical protein
MLGKGFYAKLDQFKCDEADGVGRRRYLGSREIGAVCRIGDSAPNIDKLADVDILGARCERAAWIFFPTLTWNRYAHHLPDLGDRIDVKGKRLDHHDLLVQPDRVKLHWIYLFVSAENHPYYWMAGWAWGHEVAQAPLRLKRPCHLIPVDELRPFRTLLEYVHGQGQEQEPDGLFGELPGRDGVHGFGRPR